MKEKIKSLKLNAKQKVACGYAGLVALLGNFIVVSPAFAESGQGMLTNVIQLLAKGVIFLGGAMCLWGIIQLGMAIKDGSGSGGQLGGAIAFIIGGGLIVGAGIIFQSFTPDFG